MAMADTANTIHMLFIDKYGDASAALADALSGSDHVGRLESAVSSVTGRQAVAVSSFDGALHTALHLCGAGANDYVFVPSYTFYSYIATVANIGAIPVFLDCDPTTRCVSAAAVETALLWAALQNKPPKAVVIDNAFGSAADFTVLVPLCKAWDVPTVELCGEYDGVHGGNNCDYGVIGFGRGGGAVLTCFGDADAARRFARYEYTDGQNFDYRMSDFSASFDYAMLPVIKRLAERARRNLAFVAAAANNVAEPAAGGSGAYALCKTDNARAIEKSGFVVKKPPPVHTLARYSDCPFFEHEPDYSVCSSLGEHCLISMDFSPLKRYKLVRLLAGG